MLLGNIVSVAMGDEGRSLQQMAISSMSMEEDSGEERLDQSDGYFEAGYLVMASFW